MRPRQGACMINTARGATRDKDAVAVVLKSHLHGSYYTTSTYSTIAHVYSVSSPCRLMERPARTEGLRLEYDKNPLRLPTGRVETRTHRDQTLRSVWLLWPAIQIVLEDVPAYRACASSIT